MVPYLHRPHIVIHAVDNQIISTQCHYQDPHDGVHEHHVLYIVLLELEYQMERSVLDTRYEFFA